MARQRQGDRDGRLAGIGVQALDAHARGKAWLGRASTGWAELGKARDICGRLAATGVRGPDSHAGDVVGPGKALARRGADGQGLASTGRAWQGEAGTFSKNAKDETVTNLFEPKNGVAQWRAIYEHIITLAVGDIITHERLAGLVPEAAESSVRQAFYRAVKELEDENSRTFASVRGVGYRLVEAREHEGLAQNHHRRSRRQLGKAKRKLHSADRSRLTADEKQRFTALEIHVSQQQDMLRRLSAKQAQMQTAQVQTNADVVEVKEQVTRLTALLERHGITTDAKATA